MLQPWNDYISCSIPLLLGIGTACTPEGMHIPLMLLRSSSRNICNLSRAALRPAHSLKFLQPLIRTWNEWLLRQLSCVSCNEWLSWQYQNKYYGRLTSQISHNLTKCCHAAVFWGGAQRHSHCHMAVLPYGLKGGACATYVRSMRHSLVQQVAPGTERGCGHHGSFSSFDGRYGSPCLCWSRSVCIGWACNACRRTTS